jgi:hypothetical protein
LTSDDRCNVISRHVPPPAQWVPFIVFSSFSNTTSNGGFAPNTVTFCHEFLSDWLNVGLFKDALSAV